MQFCTEAYPIRNIIRHLLGIQESDFNLNTKQTLYRKILNIES